MEITDREIWVTLHGFLGAGFILAFTGAFVGLWGMRPGVVAIHDVRGRVPLLMAGMWGMATIAWLTAIVGTYVIFPWYRSPPPPGVADFSGYPSYLLLSDPDTKLFHKLGMELKENWGWMVPILTTAVAFVATYYGPRLAHEQRMRQLLMGLLLLAFGIASVVGMFGILASKAAPVQ